MNLLDDLEKSNSGVRLFLQTVAARAYPRIIGQQRERSWMFFDIFLPLLAVSAYVFVYRAIKAPDEYIGFVVMGGAMTAFWMVMTSALAATAIPKITTHTQHAITCKCRIVNLP